MRFPSLDALAGRGRDVLARFPYTLAAGAVAAAAAIAASMDAAPEYWLRITLVAALGLPFTVAVSLLAEVRRWPRVRTAAVMLTGALALAAFYAVWPGPEEKHHAIRYFQLSAALHLIVAFLPFVGLAESPAFWQHNRRLFLSFLRAVVFSGVLFVGLAIALAALDKLFGVDIHGETYQRLWFVMAFVVNTWIFLGGLPDDVLALDTDTAYPRALKIFTQYILTPLVAVYLMILLAYLVKIVGTGQWPSGWIGYLVTSVSVAGILGFLLVHPLRDDPEEGWIRTYRRWVFVALVPAALMLLVAFWKRIAPYGLTELRYLGLLLGLWLLGIALLFTVRREHGIRVIPLSLSVLLLVTLFGPLSAIERSIRSQASRLAREVATANATPSPRVVSDAEREASGALRFLVEHHAGREIAAAFGGRIPGGVALPDTVGWRADSVSRDIMTAASLDYSQWTRHGGEGYYNYNMNDRAALALEGYAWLVPVNDNDSLVTVGADTLRVAFDTTTLRVQVTPAGSAPLVFLLGDLVDRLDSTALDANRAVAPEKMRVPEAGGARAQLLVSWMSGRRDEKRLRIDSWRARLLLPGAP